MAQHGSNRFLQFNYIPYPLWRRQSPPGVQALVRPLLMRHYPVREDRPSPTVEDVRGYLRRFRLLPGHSDADLTDALQPGSIPIAVTEPEATPAHTENPVRLPAQWEPTERVMISWPVNFPPLWPLHAAMTAAIAPVADVQINVPGEVWAGAVRLYLAAHGLTNFDRVRFYDLPTDDIWIRDYGPYVGYDANGHRTAVTMTYDPLPNYPQAQDNAMPTRWAAHEGLPVNALNFHGEGGNVWSDGAGTLLMTNQAYRLNPDLTRPTLLKTLRRGFIFDKLILLPRLRAEETGHVDLLIKLASADTVLISAPGALFTADRLRAARAQLSRETNAGGARYDLHTLPTPPLYMNWFGFPIRRSYTNALTVNGRVLVPVYGVPTDDAALRVYEQAMPGYDLCPIPCAVGANGGGAVHCLTKEVPAALPGVNGGP